MFNKLFLILNKKIIIVASLIAIFVTGLTMISFFVVSTDFSYVRFNFDYISGTKNMGSHVYIYPKGAESDISNIGKRILGQAGFPFSSFSDCTLVERDNNKIYPICESFSFGEYLLAPLTIIPFLNFFVWTFFFYSLLTFIQALRKKDNRQKTAFIFAIAIAILIISVFANDLIGSMTKL